jgi:predicted MPP superfamily phosphohydrolase
VVRLIAFMVLVPVVWALAHAYIGRRLVRGFELQGRAAAIAWAAVIALAVPPILASVLARVTKAAWPDSIQLVAFLFLGASSILFVLVVVGDLVLLGNRLLQRWRQDDSRVVDASRRSFLHRAVNIGVIGSAGSVVGVGYAQAGELPRVVEVDVPIPNLPEAAEGFRIVQLTDVHIGPTLKRDFMARIVALANELRPDVVAVTGDLIDGWVEQLAYDVEPLAELRARHGAFFVTGNHEYYWDGLSWCDAVRGFGLTVLCNEHVVIEHEGAKILLAGVTDHSAGGMVAEHASDPAKARAGAPAHDCSVLLAHQPRSIDAAAAARYDLQISGHTHGGQYFPFNVFVHLVQPYVSGLHRHDDTWIYVSRGTGYWGPPLRVGAPSEITLIRLVRA